MINGFGANDWALSQAQISRFEPGVLQDANTYLASWWSVGRVRFANAGSWTSSRAHRPGWRMFFTRHGLGTGVIGYHSVDRCGPYAVVSVSAAQLWRTPVSLAVSHELNEMLVDPYADAVTRDGFRVEIVDPVADAYATLKGVAVADFVTPNWYAWYSRGPWDAARVLASDHATTPQGYAPTTSMKEREQVPRHLHEVTLRLPGSGHPELALNTTMAQRLS